jgi:hypothetical protein
LKTVWKEAVVTEFEVLSQDAPEGPAEDHENPVRIAGLQAEI